MIIIIIIILKFENRQNSLYDFQENISSESVPHKISSPALILQLKATELLYFLVMSLCAGRS